MYCKVLIIDDEYIMRQGIRHMIEWEKEGYVLVGEAADGEEGLALIEEYQPDIVLADIVMPVLDGMEFSMILKKRFPKIRLIILSSYDNFEYVKKTLLNGACDYILKPSLNPKVLLELLEKTAAKIPGMSLQKDSELSVREKLNRYLSGYEADLTQGDFKQRFPYTKCRLLLSKEGTGSEGRLGDGIELVHFMQDYWGRQDSYETEILLIGGEVCVAVLNYRIKDEKTVVQQAQECVRKAGCYRPDGFWICGEPFDGLNSLQEHYAKALELAELSFYYKDTSFLTAADGRERRRADRFSYEQYAELLKCRNFKEALNQMEAYVVYMCSCMVEEYLLKNTTKNLIYNFLLEREKAEGVTQINKSQLFRKIDHSRYQQDFQRQLSVVVEELGRDCRGLSASDDSLSEIKQDIREHYAENLELAQIAKQFNYNYNYLSTYFNRKMQESFSEYLNQIRIERACEILKTTSYTIAQVSELVGYSDPSYFSRIFKNQMGRTPSQWKRRIWKSE